MVVVGGVVGAGTERGVDLCDQVEVECHSDRLLVIRLKPLNLYHCSNPYFQMATLYISIHILYTDTLTHHSHWEISLHMTGHLTYNKGNRD